MLNNYEELKILQRSYQPCLKVYNVSTGFPKEEREGLALQLKGRYA